MKAKCFANKISQFLDNEAYNRIDIVGVMHTISLRSDRVEDVTVDDELLYIEKTTSFGEELLIINPDQIVYVRGIAEVK